MEAWTKEFVLSENGQSERITAGESYQLFIRFSLAFTWRDGSTIRQKAIGAHSYLPPKRTIKFAEPFLPAISLHLAICPSLGEPRYQLFSQAIDYEISKMQQQQRSVCFDKPQAIHL